MAKVDKRLKRAKEKAKAARIKKQATKQELNGADIVILSPEMLTFFETLPPLDENFSCVPPIKEYVLKNKKISHSDADISVATMVVLYGHWFTTQINSLLQSELINHAMLIASAPKFIQQINA